MGRVSTSNYAGAVDTTFQWATSGNDRFSRELDLYRLAQALEIHDHSAGKGLAVARIQNGLVGSDQLAADAVTTEKIADNAITSVLVALDALGALDIAPGAIGTSEIADDAITQVKMGDQSVGTNELANTSVTAAKMALLAITTGNIQDGAVGGTKIGNDQVSTQHYAPGSVDVFAIGANAVTGAHVLDASLGGADIGNDQVSTNHYAPGSVDTAALGDGQVTDAKIAGMDGSKLVDSSVTQSKLAVAIPLVSTATFAGDGATKNINTGLAILRCVVLQAITGAASPRMFILTGHDAIGLIPASAIINVSGSGFTGGQFGVSATTNAVGSTYRWVAIGY